MATSLHSLRETMDGISISAASGMQARMQSLEMLANNLANAETGGFKADREFYSLFTSADATADPQTGDLTTLPVIETQWTDLAQGELKVTGNPLDLAIEGDGLFAVQTARGVRYTRNGSFRVSSAGVLVAADGSPIRARGGSQIAVESNRPIEVLEDGTVQQGGQSAGQIETASFAPGMLVRDGSNYFSAAEGAKPKSASGSVLQGKLEGSNVTPASSAVRLVSIMRQFEMLQKAMSIGNDLNRAAIEQVAKVGS
ncbi:MAG TPA: flagellar hook basal-body protein [Bryobacteraceae bacterium]|nr:flagellar hook basal-body protein [Bryobacteraceae bacterium]